MAFAIPFIFTVRYLNSTAVLWISFVLDNNELHDFAQKNPVSDPDQKAPDADPDPAKRYDPSGSAPLLYVIYPTL
jgi:hypothetical protein